MNRALFQPPRQAVRPQFGLVPHVRAGGRLLHLPQGGHRVRPADRLQQLHHHQQAGRRGRPPGAAAAAPLSAVAGRRSAAAPAWRRPSPAGRSAGRPRRRPPPGRPTGRPGPARAAGRSATSADRRAASTGSRVAPGCHTARAARAAVRTSARGSAGAASLVSSAASSARASGVAAGVGVRVGQLGQGGERAASGDLAGRPVGGPSRPGWPAAGWWPPGSAGAVPCPFWMPVRAAGDTTNRTTSSSPVRTNRSGRNRSTPRGRANRMDATGSSRAGMKLLGSSAQAVFTCRWITQASPPADQPGRRQAVAASPAERGPGGVHPPQVADRRPAAPR